MPYEPPAPALPLPQGVANSLYTAVEALRLTDAVFERMLTTLDEGDFDQSIVDHVIEEYMAANMQSGARHFAAILQEIAIGVPTVPDRVFATIRQHDNRCLRNSPVIEAALLALLLAERSVDAVLDHYDAKEGPAYDELSEFLFFVFDCVSLHRSFLNSFVTEFDEAKALDAIIAGEPMPVYVRRFNAPADELLIVA
jgi:hypothetical protein